MPYFKYITSKLERVARINQEEMVNEVFQQPKISAFTVDLIKWEQLYKGISGTGNTLESIGGGYAQSTIRDKLRLGLPTDRVTLFQHGDYYESIFMIVPSGNDVDILVESDPIKNGYDIRRRWGDNLTELTDESTRKLALEILPLLRRAFLNTWTGKI